MNDSGDAMLLFAVESLYGPLQWKNHFRLDRGPYKIAASLDESVSDEPYVLEGSFIDLFDPTLPIVTRKELAPGTQAFLYDLRKAPRPPPSSPPPAAPMTYPALAAPSPMCARPLRKLSTSPASSSAASPSACLSTASRPPISPGIPLPAPSSSASPTAPTVSAWKSGGKS